MFYRKNLSPMWKNYQYDLFSQLESDIGELSPLHKKLVKILEMVRVEEFLPCRRFDEGRPSKDRSAIARAFIAKVVFKITYTKELIAYLKKDKQLRVICGWDAYKILPSESKFSRVFKEFSKLALPEKVHQALIKEVYKDQIVSHVIKDSTPIEAREKFIKKDRSISSNILKSRKRRARLKNQELNRRQKQLKETNLDTIINDLPNQCDKGMKKSAQGYTVFWKGYKLHTAVDDMCVPLAVIVTSASLNDCEAAIPLTKKTHLVADNFYDLMDAAYDHPEIKEHSALLGHVPLIDSCPQNKAQKILKVEEKARKKNLGFKTAEDKRYKERFSKERFNALYKDYYGGRNIFYRGHSKVCCHIMFGILVIAASTIIKLIQ
jgi:hypothetical protein